MQLAFKFPSESDTRYVPPMVWRDQHPPASDVLLEVYVPFSGGRLPARLEIDKLSDGKYRATVGTVFEHQELCRTSDLERLLRHVHVVPSCGSFEEMVAAVRAI